MRTARFVLACSGAPMVRNVHFRPGMRYLVEARDGVVLRAAPVDPPAGDGRLADERRLLRDSVRRSR